MLIGVLVGKLITDFCGLPDSRAALGNFPRAVPGQRVGIFFGVYPASKAARLDPVVGAARGDVRRGSR